MKPTALLLLVPGVLANVLQPRGCAADNCARAVTGTAAFKLPASVRRADCSSFQATTVTPAPTTETVTVTVTAGAVVIRAAEALAPRQVTAAPTAVPAYASACAGPNQYRSACSCWSITPMTTTLPTPTETVTATVTYQPNGACNGGGTCFTYAIITDPSCGEFGCSCATDADNRSVCVEHGFCIGTCGTDTDCGDGKVCIKDSCCGSNVCLSLAHICPNVLAKRYIFKGGKTKRDDCQMASHGCV